jgi:hypothetical protein
MRKALLFDGTSSTQERKDMLAQCRDIFNPGNPGTYTTALNLEGLY